MKITRRRLLAVGASLPLVATTRPSRAAAPVVRIGNSFPVAHPLNVRLREAAREIEKRTDGKLVVRIFPDSQLGSDGDMMSQVRSGALNAVCTSLLFLESLEPSANLAGLGYGYKDYAQVWQVWDGEVGDHVRARLARLNLHSLPKVYDNGFRQVTNSVRPIRTPDDLAGLKIRVPAVRIQQSLFSHLGAAPTPMAIKETYSGLKTHIVDGQENALTHVEFWKFYEVQKYVSTTSHMWDGLSVVCNADKLKAMPDDVRKTFSDTLDEFALLQRKDMVALMTSLRTTISGKGMEFNDVDPAPFQKKLEASGYYEEWRKVIGDEAWGLYRKMVSA